MIDSAAGYDSKRPSKSSDLIKKTIRSSTIEFVVIRFRKLAVYEFCKSWFVGALEYMSCFILCCRRFFGSTLSVFVGITKQRIHCRFSKPEGNIFTEFLGKPLQD